MFLSHVKPCFFKIVLIHHYASPCFPAGDYNKTPRTFLFFFDHQMHQFPTRHSSWNSNYNIVERIWKLQLQSFFEQAAWEFPAIARQLWKLHIKGNFRSLGEGLIIISVLIFQELLQYISVLIPVACKCGDYLKLSRNFSFFTTTTTTRPKIPFFSLMLCLHLSVIKKPLISHIWF